MNKASRLQKGDKIAVASLSRGLLGEDFTAHNLELGIKRLKDFGVKPVFMPNSLKGLDFIENNPQARAEDLKAAFLDPEIKAIICAIGGDDTYRTLPYLMEDQEFIDAIANNPKIFTGFSDTTINHLMFYKLGLTTYYGHAYITDLGEIADDMLPYNKKYFSTHFADSPELKEIKPSPIWYEERTDFSPAALGSDRVAYKDPNGFELLQGNSYFKGRLLGGCIESLADMLEGSIHDDQADICARYSVFPGLDEWKNKILFIETSEEKPDSDTYKKYLQILKNYGIFDVINGIIVGKPQDQAFYQEYKKDLVEIIDNPDLPILYNVNFGHANPRAIIPLGIEAEVDYDQQVIRFTEKTFG